MLNWWLLSYWLKWLAVVVRICIYVSVSTWSAQRYDILYFVLLWLYIIYIASAKSPHWNWIKSGAMQMQATCATGNGKNTTNLFHHLKMCCHPEQLAGAATRARRQTFLWKWYLTALRRLLLLASFSIITSYDKSSKRGSGWNFIF